MSNMVIVTIPLDAEAARGLESPIRRDAVGRYLKSGRVRDVLGGPSPTRNARLAPAA
jgi:hypothetical protein